MSPHVSDESGVPRGNVSGFSRYFQNDILSGFLVFLIALPLCLGISIASGFPPIAGVFTAVIGSVIATLISNSELTIKGPAAGLIVIVLGSIEAFGGDGMSGGWSPEDLSAYRATLAVGVVAAVLQVLFGVFRAGILGEFFPVSAVHGMLAAIGVIIISKQIPVALGVSAKGGPLELLRQIPEFIADANPAIAAIGLVSLIIMFAWPILRTKAAVLSKLPAPLIVLLVAVPMGMTFNLVTSHSYSFLGHQYELSDMFLVKMPSRVFGMFDELTLPDFAALRQPKAWGWVFMFFIIGSLESLLSAKAVDLIDPWKRKTNMDRDIVAVGVGNLACSMVGGLPMISEIVRSKANIDNGGRTRFANFWHGMFLLGCVAMIPMVLHRIPMAALAAMLIYTGFRLAHPQEFMNVLRIGREQFVIFCVTLLSVLATDLLIGIGIGIATKMLILITNGVPLASLFTPQVEVVEDDGRLVRLRAYQSAVFSNWIPIRRQIEHLGLRDRKNIELDLAETRLVDHSVMDKLHELQEDFDQQGLRFDVVGLESHQPFADHAQAARRRGLWTAHCLTIDADPSLERTLIEALVDRGATGYTILPCSGVGKRELMDNLPPRDCVRIEVIAPPAVCRVMRKHLQRELQPLHRLTFRVTEVKVARIDAFTASDDRPVMASMAVPQESPVSA